MPRSPTLKLSCAQLRRGCCPTSRRPRRCQLPIWVLLVSLSTLSLIVVGTLTFELSQLWSGQAIDFVAVKYRELACATVQSRVMDFLSEVTTSVRQAAMYAAVSTVGPEASRSEELRKLILTRMIAIESLCPQCSAATALSLGSPAELAGVMTDTLTGNLFWILCSNATGDRKAFWPATVPASVSGVECGNCTAPMRGLWSDSDWKQRYKESFVDPAYCNATDREWYKAAVSSRLDVTVGPTEAIGGPHGGALETVLVLPVVAPVRSPSGEVLAVVTSSFDLIRIDAFFRSFVSNLFPGTVSFMVEAPTGYLIASSEPWIFAVQTPENPSGDWNRVLANQTNTTV
eukprot:RCo018740